LQTCAEPSVINYKPSGYWRQADWLLALIRGGRNPLVLSNSNTAFGLIVNEFCPIFAQLAQKHL
jgi:hypothetical protein